MSQLGPATLLLPDLAHVQCLLQVLPGGAAKADFKPTTLWRGEGLDWWGSDIM
jgi:hypothetical protein